MTARMRKRMKAFGRAREGNAVVEFALVTPAMALMVVVMFDVAMALGAQVAMDRTLRAGAQAAMSDPGVEEVREAVRISASTRIGVSAGEPMMSVRVERWCSCHAPAQPEEVHHAACDAACPDGRHPYAYYDLEAARTYSGVIAPPVPLASSARIQVR